MAESAIEEALALALCQRLADLRHAKGTLIALSEVLGTTVPSLIRTMFETEA